MDKKTLVLGATLNPNKYSNMAIKRLKAKGVEIQAIARRKGEVEGITIGTELLNFKNIYTVTLYVNAKKQLEYYNYIIDLKPKRILFNPGT